MRLTDLVEQIDGRYRCNVCQWRCELASGDTGRCLVRSGVDEGIDVINDGLISAATVGMVEDHQLWHFFPTTPVLTIGGWGYAFPADQQRGQYATIPEESGRRRRLEPDRAALVALDKLCRGVVWTYSDPSVSQEYLLDLLRSCRANSRYTAIVTTGYMTIETLNQMGHYLDGLSIDIRGFDDLVYKRLAGVDHWRGILDVAIHARQRWSCHIEITTRMHPGVNDAPEQITALGEWICTNLGAYTPWHVLPGDAGTAAAASVARARRLGREAGLHFVYGPDPAQSTACYSCGATVIERTAIVTRVVGLTGSACTACGTDLKIRTSIFKPR